MFDGLTQWILEAIRSHGMLAVILGIAIETVIVPIPSPLVLMSAGAILVEPNLPLAQALLKILLYITIPATIASTIGSYLVYGIGYFGGKPLIDKYEKLHGVSWDEILMFKKKFERKGREGITLALLRAIPIVPLSVVSGVAGVIKMDWKKFTIFTFLGILPRAFILVFLGWNLSSFYMTLADHIDNVESVVTVLLVLAILAYVIGHKTGMINKMRKRILR